MTKKDMHDVARFLKAAGGLREMISYVRLVSGRRKDVMRIIQRMSTTRDRKRWRTLCDAWDEYERSGFLGLPTKATRLYLFKSD